MENKIVKIKELRQSGDKLIQEVKELPKSRETSLVITKMQEAVMWLGMELKRINDSGEANISNPYPSSKDPSSGDRIEPTADGLKF